MSVIETLMQRNRDFAEDFKHGDLEMASRMNVLVVTCADARVNPSDFLALEPGEVPVLRSVGGRVTENVLRDLCILSTLGSRKKPERRGKLTIIVVHHNDCGSVLMNDSEICAEVMGIEREALEALAIEDPMLSVVKDVEVIRGYDPIPEGTVVAGYVYNEKTGELLEAAHPEAIRR